MSMYTSPFGYDGQPTVRPVLRAGRLVDMSDKEIDSRSSSRSSTERDSPSPKPTEKLYQNDNENSQKDLSNMPTQLAQDMLDNRKGLETFETLLQSSQRDLHGNLLHEAVIKCLRKAGLVVDLNTFRDWLKSLDIRRNGTVSLKSILTITDTLKSRLTPPKIFEQQVRPPCTPPHVPAKRASQNWVQFTYYNLVSVAKSPRPSPLRKVSQVNSSQPASTSLTQALAQTPNNVQVNSFTRYNKLPPINSEAKKSEKIEITNDSCAETTSLRRSVTNLHSWLQGFDAMNRAMLSQCDADGLLSSSELARILNNFDLVYNMSLPKGLVVELIEKLESPAFTIDAHEFCSQFLKQLQQNNPALSEKNTSI
eukprot:gene6414-9315_t